MKYVINADFGGFSVPDEVQAVLDCGRYAWDYDGDIRTNETLIAWVEANKGKTDLAIAEIPDNATDWELDEYDGFESITAVVNGKLVHIGADSNEEDED